MLYRAVILDRNGVTNDLVVIPVTTEFESPLSPIAVKIVNGVVDTVSEVKAPGFVLRLTE